MTKTAQDIVTLALRQIQVVALGEEPEADDYTYALPLYEAEFDRINDDHGFGWAFTADTVPDTLFAPMATVAASVLTAYGRPLPSQTRAIGMMRSIYFPDDRTDSADMDGDGYVTDDERAAADRAAYF